jgi:hypothetical protein
MKTAPTQFKDKNRIAGFVWSLGDSRAIILGLALLHLVVTYVWMRNWYKEFGQGAVSFYPDSFVVTPLVLVFASLLLLIGRRWGYVLALVIGVWVLYSVGYLPLRGVAAAHDLRLFSFTTLQRWLTQVWVGQPQHFLQLALAFIIAGDALVAVSCHWLQARRAV